MGESIRELGRIGRGWRKGGSSVLCTTAEHTAVVMSAQVTLQRREVMSPVDLSDSFVHEGDSWCT